MVARPAGRLSALATEEKGGRCSGRQAKIIDGQGSESGGVSELGVAPPLRVLRFLERNVTEQIRIKTFIPWQYSGSQRP